MTYTNLISRIVYGTHRLIYYLSLYFDAQILLEQFIIVIFQTVVKFIITATFSFTPARYV